VAILAVAEYKQAVQVEHREELVADTLWNNRRGVDRWVDLLLVLEVGQVVEELLVEELLVVESVVVELVVVKQV
jgi:hypothetical protein